MTPLSMCTSRSETHVDTYPFASDERWLVGNFEACTFCRATFRAVSEVNSVMFVISDWCKVTASQEQSRTYAAKRLDLTKGACAPVVCLFVFCHCVDLPSMV